MTCRKTKKISAYLDGELNQAEKNRIELHLRGCEACRLRLDTYENLRGGFRQSERQNAPAWFSRRVMSRVRERSSRPSVLLPLTVRLAEVMVIVLIITVGIISGRLLVNGNQMPMTGTPLTSMFSLDVFDAAPPDSPGGVYLAMMEEKHEK